MRVSNEYVQVSLGKRVFTRKNMILNRYLQHLIDMQFIENNDLYGARFTEVIFQLEIPKEVNKNDEINYYSDGIYNFTGRFTDGTYQQITNKNSIKLIQSFSQGNLYYIGGTIYYGDDDYLIGQKLTGVGFGISGKLMTWVDLSDMNIIIQEGEKLNISRVDNFSTDLEITGYNYPRHLTNLRKESYSDQNPITAVFLYSIGLGEDKDYMNKEYVIGEDVSINMGNMEFTIPITKETKNQIYPSENLQAFSNIYPSKATDNYIIYKYKIYKVVYVDDEITYEDTGKYYLGSIKIKNENLQYIKTKIRSD